jgi:hypothetical protein
MSLGASKPKGLNRIGKKICKDSLGMREENLNFKDNQII